MSKRNENLVKTAPLFLIVLLFTIKFFYPEALNSGIYYTILTIISALAIGIISYNFRKNKYFKTAKKHKLILFALAVIVTLSIAFINILQFK